MELKPRAGGSSRRGQGRGERAALCGVSPRSVESASKVKARGAPALVEAVRTGNVAVSAAAEVADLPEEEQVAALGEEDEFPGLPWAPVTTNFVVALGRHLEEVPALGQACGSTGTSSRCSAGRARMGGSGCGARVRRLA
jgi:hypothetical protein